MLSGCTGAQQASTGAPVGMPSAGYPQPMQQGQQQGAYNPGPQQQLQPQMQQPAGRWAAPQGPRPIPRPILGGVAHPHAAKQYPL